MIANHENNFPRKTIGVFTPSIKHQSIIRNALKGRTKNEVMYYNYQKNEENMPDITYPGIKLITYESAKGLEFDSVFIPELHEYTEKQEEIYTRMKLYVLITRARNHLYITFNREKDYGGRLYRLFPDNDSDIIKYL